MLTGAANFQSQAESWSSLACPSFQWISRSQRSVSMSSTEAEYFACCVITKEVLFLRELLHDFGYTQKWATPIFTDNKGVVDLTFDPVSFKKTKHILRAAEFARDYKMRKFIDVQWIPGDTNVADLFTKAVTLPIFRELIKLMWKMHTLPRSE